MDLAEVAVALGLTVPRLRELRRTLLVEGEDYRFVSNRTLILPRGSEKLRAHLHLADPSPVEAPAAATPKKARVLSHARDLGGGVRKHFPNATVIRCELVDAPGCPVFVRVKHSQNYSPKLRNGDPMMVEVEERDGRWVALGRAPRFPGKW